MVRGSVAGVGAIPAAAVRYDSRNGAWRRNELGQGRTGRDDGDDDDDVVGCGVDGRFVVRG